VNVADLVSPGLIECVAVLGGDDALSKLGFLAWFTLEVFVSLVVVDAKVCRPEAEGHADRHVDGLNLCVRDRELNVCLG